MEHKPWLPKTFKDKSQRILIVGNSHWKSDDDEDYADFTIDCVRLARDGEMQWSPFFARQPKYIFLERDTYYNHVALINYIPVALPDRYAYPPPDLIERAKDRLVRLLVDISPTHTFILSSRYDFGEGLPKTNEEKAGSHWV